MLDRIIRSLTAAVRAFSLGWHVLKGVLMVAVLFPYAKSRERDVIIRQWSLDCLRILNVHVRIKGDAPPSETTSVLFIANHVSWLDILALNAIKRVRFVAKSEVREWPVVGWLAARTGTLFLKRDRPFQLIRLNRSLQAALKQGQCVALFPEGTTSDGRTVLHFHSGLLESAVASHSLIWPVALHYRGSDGRPAASVAFVGDLTLIESLWRVMTQPVVHVNLHFTPPLAGSQFDRHDLARQARAAILSKLIGEADRLTPNPSRIGPPIDWSDEPSAAA